MRRRNNIEDYMDDSDELPYLTEEMRERLNRRWMQDHYEQKNQANSAGAMVYVWLFLGGAACIALPPLAEYIAPITVVLMASSAIISRF